MLEHEQILYKLPSHEEEAESESFEEKEEEAHVEEKGFGEEAHHDKEGSDSFPEEAHGEEEANEEEEGYEEEVHHEDEEGAKDEEEGPQEDRTCCKENCVAVGELLCSNCNHLSCPTDVISSYFENEVKICTHCLNQFREHEGYFVSKDCEITEQLLSQDESEESEELPPNPFVSPVTSDVSEVQNLSFSSLTPPVNESIDENKVEWEPWSAEDFSPAHESINRDEVERGHWSGDELSPNRSMSPCSPTVPIVMQIDSTPVVETQIQSICLFCILEVGYLGPHLKTSGACREQYAELFNLPEGATVAQIYKARKNVGRQDYPSRQPVQRREERTRRKDLRNDIDAFNKFKKKSQEERIFRCYKCSKLDLKLNMQIANPDVVPAFTFKRENKFWECLECLDDKQTPLPAIPFLENFGSVIVADTSRRIYVPGLETSEPEAGILPSRVLLPNSVSATLQHMGSREPRSRSDISNLLSKGRFYENQFPSTCYENKLKQLKDSAKFGSVVTGKVVDNDLKKVKIIDQKPNTSNVKGSLDYYGKLKQDLKFAIYSLGSVFMVVKVQLPKVIVLFANIWAACFH